MKVSRIEAFGFKSFMERLSLPLHPGITGVVGPNGCGKSNIVDAIRWVLGESRAKNLRGDLLEDVIFNGTDKLRPLGLAEVSITVQSDGNDFFQDLISPELEAELVAEGGVFENEEVIIELDLANSIHKGKNRVSQTATGSLLEKYSWLKSASEVQVTRRLYRSGESEFFINQVPCRLKDLKDFFRAIGLSTKGFTIVAQGEVARIITSRPEQRRKVLEEAAGVQGFRDRINTTTSRLAETRQNLDRLEDIISEVSRQVNSLKRQANKAKNREDLKTEIKELDQKIYSHRLFSLRRNLSAGEATLAAFEEQLRSVEEKVATKKESDAAMRRSLQEVDQQSEELRRALDRTRRSLNETIKVRSGKHEKLNQLVSDQKSTQAQILRSKENIENLERRIETQATEQVKLHEEIRILQTESEELEVVNTQMQGLKQQMHLQGKEIQKKREALVALQSELNTLSSQLAKVMPEEKVRQAAKNLGLGDKLQQVFDAVNADPEYTQAVEAALGQQSEFILHTQAKKLAGVVFDENNPEVFGAVRAATCQVDYGDIPFKALSDVCRISSEADGILNGIYLVDSIAQAEEYFEQHPESLITLVTGKGILIKSNSISYTPTGGLVQASSRVKELEDLCYVAKEDLARMSDKKAALLKELEGAEASERKLREISNQLSALTARLQSADKLLEQLQRDREQENQRFQNAETELGRFTALISELETMPEGDTAGEEKLQQELENLEVQYNIVEAERKNTLAEQQKAGWNWEQSRDELDALKSSISEAKLKLQKFEIETENLREKVEEEYGTEFFNHCSCDLTEEILLDSAEYAESKERVYSLKARIQREGDIDPESIERFEEESARLEDLNSQKADLTAAAKTIEETLKRLTEASEKRFTETFSQVAENFSRLIPKLFGGGSGSIELNDPNNPLEAGLEITARPPGKKLKSIELMSGGEKALCATALIVSMFLVRPSPLCILDEVDAPLDDANLARFLGIIKEMSSETQFLLITHNKQSMSVADNLVGVTMQQPGATNIISVSLNEAEEVAVAA